MIYFVQDEHLVKIGYTTNLVGRLKSFRTANSRNLRTLGTMDGDRDLERSIHDRFARHRVRGEWFVLCNEIVEFIGTSCGSEIKTISVGDLTEKQIINNNKRYFLILISLMAIGVTPEVILKFYHLVIVPWPKTDFWVISLNEFCRLVNSAELKFHNDHMVIAVFMGIIGIISLSAAILLAVNTENPNWRPWYPHKRRYRKIMETFKS